MNTDKTTDTDTDLTPTIAAMPAHEPDPLFELNQTKARLLERDREVQMLRDDREALRAELKRLNENQFLMAVGCMDAGDVMREAGAALTGLVAEIQRLQEKGSMTLKLLIKPMQGTVATLVMAHEIKVSGPKPEKRSSIFFADEHGVLSRQDPRQRELFAGESGGGEHRTSNIER